MASRLIGYEPWLGAIQNSRSGALVATESGQVLAHGLTNAQERLHLRRAGRRGVRGMVVGQHPRDGDLPVNVCPRQEADQHARQHLRYHDQTDAGRDPEPRAVARFLADDELLEVTPKHLRLRKRLLTQDERAKAKKRADMAHRRLASATASQPLPQPKE
ncbi:MAG: hypothetical protein R2843_14305 [Thermomicrobiales bacterium]